MITSKACWMMVGTHKDSSASDKSIAYKILLQKL